MKPTCPKCQSEAIAGIFLKPGPGMKLLTGNPLSGFLGVTTGGGEPDVWLCMDCEHEFKEAEKAEVSSTDFGLLQTPINANLEVVWSEADWKNLIAIFNRAIEENPEVAVLFRDRAVAYGMIGDQGHGIEDLKMAARLGNEDAQDLLRSKGINW